jgi:hypothetical protein
MENQFKSYDMASQLKQYLETTPKEEVVEGWEQTKEFDEVGVPMDEFLKSKTQNKMKLFLVNGKVVKNDLQYSIEQEGIRNHIVHAETELEAEEKVRNYWISQGEEYHYSYWIHIYYVQPAIL